MKTLSKSRDLSFDVTRVVCTLWIVGIWHLMNYIPNQAPAALTTGIGEPVTITALSCLCSSRGISSGNIRSATGPTSSLFTGNDFPGFTAYIFFRRSPC